MNLRQGSLGLIPTFRACFKSGLLPPDFVEKILKSSSTAVYTPVLKPVLNKRIYGFALLVFTLLVAYIPSQGFTSIIPVSGVSPLLRDPLFPYQWALQNNGQTLVEDIDDIHSIPVVGKIGWDVGVSELLKEPSLDAKRKVVVAIIDSGIDLEHRDLKNNLMRNEKECDEGGKIPFRPNLDKDLNGYKGDCIGWNFTASDGGDNRPWDNSGHGTHVAGIIAAEQGQYGIAGLASNVRLLPLKVLKDDEGSEDANSELTDRVALAIRYAVKMGAEVINLSLGWPYFIDTQDVRSAVAEAYQLGVVIVAAAGNNHSDRSVFPCAYEEVICVGSVSANGGISGFSNFGASIDLLAPGTQIISTFPTALTPLGFGIHGYEIMSGTSQSAPYVSAAAAFLMGMESERKTSVFSVLEIRARLVLGSKPAVVGGEGQGGLGGFIHVKDSMEMMPTALVRPLIKNLNIIPLRPLRPLRPLSPVREKSANGAETPGSDGGSVDIDGLPQPFEFHLPIQAEWMSAENIQINIHLSSADTIVFDKTTFLIDKIKLGERQVLNIRGKVVSWDRSHEVPLVVQVSQNGVEQGEYHLSLSFARDPIDNEEWMRMSIPLQAAKKTLGSSNTGSFLKHLRTITDRYRTMPNPEFFLPVKLKPGVEVFMFKSEGSEYSSRAVVLPLANEILALNRLDINADGRLDYWIYSIGEEQRSGPLGFLGGAFSPLSLGSIFENKRSLFLMMSFLNDDLTPIFPTRDFKVFPDQAVLNYETLSFLPISTAYGVMRVPFFTSVGGIPQQDRQEDPWNQEDINPSLHIYYLKPDFSRGEMVTHFLDSQGFLKQHEKIWNLTWPLQLKVTNALTQTYQDFEEGRARYVLRAGSEFPQKAYMLELRSVSGALLPSSETHPLPHTFFDFRGAGAVSMTSVSPGFSQVRSGTTFFDLHGLNRITTFWPENHQFLQYHHPFEMDALRGLLATFRSEDAAGQVLWEIFESDTRMIASVSLSDGSSQNFYHPIHRSSFVAGQVFSETFVPLALGVGAEETVLPQGYLPAIYRDSSELQSPHVSVLELTPEGFLSRIKNTVLIPPNCISMNPSRVNQREMFTLLCQTSSDKFEIWHRLISVE